MRKETQLHVRTTKLDLTLYKDLATKNLFKKLSHMIVDMLKRKAAQGAQVKCEFCGKPAVTRVRVYDDEGLSYEVAVCETRADMIDDRIDGDCGSI